MKRPVYLIVTCGAVAGLALSVLASPIVVSQLDSWKLLPRQERLSELYFTDHTKIPVTYTPDVSTSLSFTIHNFEHQTTTYRYTVVARGDQEATLAEGTVELGHDSSKEITQNFAIPWRGSRVEVRVNLQYASDQGSTTKTQSVHYWVNSTIAKKGGV